MFFENVKQLVGHNKKGKQQRLLIRLLQDLGYHVQYTVLNALDYGCQQKKENV